MQNELHADSNKNQEKVVLNQNYMLYETQYLDHNPNFNQNIAKENKQQPKQLQGIMLINNPDTFWFKKQFCILENHVLSYYNFEQQDYLEGSLNFEFQAYQYSEQLNLYNQVIEFELIPIGSNTQFKFKSKNIIQFQEWAQLVKKSVEQSDGRKKQLTFLIKIPNFWNNQQISYQNAQDQCENGDIILFKSKHEFAVAQRMILNSQYDHVAICYIQDKLLHIYEAGQNGVVMRRWDQFKLDERYKFYEKICIRKLIYNRKYDSKVQMSLQNFIQENLGHEYSVNIQKFFQFKSKLKKPSNGKKEEEEKRSYFCSELVAKAYKEMGLLDQVKSCTQYFPNDFSQQKQLKLLQGATLSPEYLVLFEG